MFFRSAAILLAALTISLAAHPAYAHDKDEGVVVKAGQRQAGSENQGTRGHARSGEGSVCDD
jgi:hypothetical protein